MAQQDTILVVDDQADIREPLCEHLVRSGFIAVSAEGSFTARKLIDQGGIDLIVLDIMMPGEDGLSLCRYLREATNTPVILLTALTDDTDRIVGLEIGADDYVTKPFNPRELVARIRAVLRRSTSTETFRPINEERIGFDRWTLNVVHCELEDRNGIIVPLSHGEFGILTVFLDYPMTTLSRNQLMEHYRGREVQPFERSIDNLISRLRRKLEEDPSNPRLLKTERGDGYRLACQVSRL